MDNENMQEGNAELNNGAKMSLHSVHALFRGTWNVYQERWRTLLEIVLVPTLVTILGYVLVGLGSPFSIIGGVLLLAGWIIFMFSVLPLIFSIHHTAGTDASYRATIGWFWPFVWLTILEILAVLGGSVVFIIPGIWFAISFIFIAYIFVIEHRRGLDALRQSKDYIKGYWWAVAGRVILLGLLFAVAAIIIEIPIEIIAGNFVREIVTLALTLFFVPFSAIYHYQIFENLRALKPDRADAQTEKGKGLIKAGAIIGIIVPVVIVALLIFFIGTGASRMAWHADYRGASPSASGMQNQ